ncbi:MAG: DNA repair protein RadA [Candidatus Dojkabacteria bacterium]|jgi:DNA repair protein RadA/Sms|nr:DNA repair protein RadA [Candidatus Dojkabacteria bacterium]
MKYICSSCESEFLRWSGKCPSCGEWGTFEELEDQIKPSQVDKSGKKKPPNYKPITKFNITSSSKSHKERLSTGYGELDRVLGGGLVGGEVVLISGEPGIGKSTILLQVALNMVKDGKEVLYVCGEESPSQLYSRLDRVSGGKSSKKFDNLLVTESTDVDEITALIEAKGFDLVIVDSIQSVSSESSRGFVGSISQVRISGTVLTRVAKQTATPIFIVGQINKMGNVAGPKILEHIVDAVLYIEGEQFNQYRILRGMKNRYGSTNEIGVFEMGSYGLKEVVNPSLVFLEDTHKVSGSAIGAVLQGSRTVFVEVQALVSERDEGGFSGPLKRVANGIKKPRLDMLCAVLTRRGGCFLGNRDVYVNVVGGLSISDPALDLAVCAAIKSASKDEILDSSTIYFGEVGLTGEVRGSWGLGTVLRESERVGYKTAIIGRSQVKKGKIQVKKVSFLNKL